MKTEKQIELTPGVAARRNLTMQTVVASLALATATDPAMAGNRSGTGALRHTATPSDRKNWRVYEQSDK